MIYFYLLKVNYFIFWGGFIYERKWRYVNERSYLISWIVIEINLKWIEIKFRRISL